MKKILENKVVIITAIIVLAIGIVLLVLFNKPSKRSLDKIDGKYYALQYDNTWSIKEKNDDKIILKHHSGSKITIEMTKLSDEYRYATMDELIDELVYNLKEQNKTYKLISKKKDTFTKDQFEGYKLLFENEKEQVMINFYKKSDKLITIRFEAESEYFDILLDSVHSIVNNLDVKDEQFDLKDSIKLELVDIFYEKSDELDKLLEDGKSYETVSSNYYVKYVLPKGFNPNALTSQYNVTKMEINSDKNIDIDVHIYNKNIYEYLDKEEALNVYSNYKFYHSDDSKDYLDFKESLSKLKSDYVSYIYKNSYKYNNAIKYDDSFNSTKYIRSDETAELIYALDNNHILVFKIKTSGIPITEKLVNMIKIKEVKNYSSYVKNEKDGNYLLGKLERFKDYKCEKVEVTTLKIPDKYFEIDDKSYLSRNMYTDRFYGSNYNEKYDYYDYKVHYNINNYLGIERDNQQTIDIINSSISTVYGKYQLLQKSQNITVNGKEFEVYDGGFTYRAGILLTNVNRKLMYVNEKVLFYKMPSGTVIYIDIRGYEKEITNEIIKDFTNFDTKEIDY